MFKRVTIFVIALFSFTALAQATGVIPADPDDLFMQELLKSIGGISGATTLGALAMLVQLFMQFMDTSMFSKIVPAKIQDYKLPVVSLLMIVSGVAGLMLKDHLTFVAAISHSTVVAAVMVFVHQWMKFAKDKPTPVQLTPVTPVTP